MTDFDEDAGDAKIVERAFDDLVALGLLIPNGRQARGFLKTGKAKAMSEDAFADALEMALACRRLPGSVAALALEAETKKAS